MEDLHLWPWVVSATHDVGDRWSLLSVCLSFFCFLLGGYALCAELRAAWLLCVRRSGRLVWRGVAYLQSRIPLFHYPVLYLRCPCIHPIRQSLYPHHRFC